LNDNLGFNIGGRQNGDVIEYSRIATLEWNKENTSHILLHELIHGVTTYVMYAYKNGDLNNEKLIEAAKTLLDVYDVVK